MPAKGRDNSLRAYHHVFYKAIQHFLPTDQCFIEKSYLQRVAHAESLPLDTQCPDGFCHTVNLPGFDLSHHALDTPIRMNLYEYFRDTQGPERLHHAAGVPDLDQLDHARAAHPTETLVAKGPATAIASPGIAPEVPLAMVSSPIRGRRVPLVDALGERARRAEQEADH